MVAGALKHLPEADQEQLAVEVMSAEALMTSEIEGEILDRASVQSSLRRQLGLAADRRSVKPAEQGIAEMMIALCRTFDEPLSEAMLFSWHRQLTNGRRDLRNIEDGNGRIGRAISEKVLAQGTGDRTLQRSLKPFWFAAKNTTLRWKPQTRKTKSRRG